MHKINKTLFFIGVVFVVVVGLVYLSEEKNKSLPNHNLQKSDAVEKKPVVSLHSKEPVRGDHSENHERRAARIPAFLENVPGKNSLPATLDPAKFTGRVREAYRIVQEIPETIAQLPCFCYCDHSFSHRSLHSCFEDEHGSRCAICINEALTAYHLQKEKNLNPEQIRGHIIGRYTR